MPTTEQDMRYGEPEATSMPWELTEQLLATAPLFWVTTVRPDGHPHVTPLVAAWLDDALHFCTGADERKGRNLAANPAVVLTTGTNALHSGTDVVLEGNAVHVSDDAELHRIAEAFLAKYGEEWHFEVADGQFRHGPGAALVYRVAPSVVFAFGKDPYSQTRYRF
ncbi:MAG TPA: pyridoxamine 5'-phosphate oxidase family protein [Mycobacteriales bacterium]|jgi:nitroimidazol reductase NimA-like FMN-containing flavoprotein (pyridoxamine 5'-phosphate oxidase superfamily)|nr:pyridoxamine 5'-phosphate oxidase family protein [Mycobacteriales bacterium]